MSKHLERDLQKLERDLLATSAIVEEMIKKAWQSFLQQSEKIAEEVIQRDEIVDQREVSIEEDCLKILALHQPVAVDLRRTATILKVNNDLERIADLAVNIAERSKRLSRLRARFSRPKLLETMAERSIDMVSKALDSLIELDDRTATKVCAADDEVDQAHAKVVSLLVEEMKANPESIESASYTLSIARFLERIADHATNIAEDVIYLVKGDIARHRHGEFVISE